MQPAPTVAATEMPYIDALGTPYINAYAELLKLPRPLDYKTAFHFVYRWGGSFSRLEIVLQLDQDELMDDLDWFRLLGYLWSGFDGMGAYTLDLLFSSFAEIADPENYSEWVDSLREDRINAMMEPAERAAYKALPDTITIYRGCYRINEEGFSWTTDRSIAEGFPTLARYRSDGDALLITAIADKRDIVAVKLDREEQEIITWMPHIVSEEIINVPSALAA